ncbi:MAG: hypothetical protein WCJ30_12690, partial [Deltaproteobacteria bacterium]
MHFIDEATITVSAGDGGAGAIAFRREAFTPLGGPSGGDGGKGADVVFVADQNVNTLLEFRFRPKWTALRGENGGGKDCNGRGGEDLVLGLAGFEQGGHERGGLARLAGDARVEEGKRWFLLGA